MKFSALFAPNKEGIGLPRDYLQYWAYSGGRSCIMHRN